MTTLLFARHGQASFGQKNYDQLSELGVKQAQLLGQLYGTSGRQISGVISGSLVRQRDSAQHFLQRYQDLFPAASTLSAPLIVEGLNEFNHEDVLIQSNPKFATQMGIFTEIAKAPMPKARLTELFYEALQRWYSGEHDDDYQESWPQFNARVQQALAQVIDLTEQPSRELSTQHPAYLIFTSGGVLAAISAYLLAQSPPIPSQANNQAIHQNINQTASQTANQIMRSLVNTGVTTVTVKNHQPRLLSLNEHSHLYQEGQSYLSWQ